VAQIINIPVNRIYLVFISNPLANSIWECLILEPSASDIYNSLRIKPRIQNNVHCRHGDWSYHYVLFSTYRKYVFIDTHVPWRMMRNIYDIFCERVSSGASSVAFEKNQNSALCNESLPPNFSTKPYLRKLPWPFGSHQQSKMLVLSETEF